MKLDLNNIDDIFRESLEDFTEQPSPGLWNKISGKMFWNDLAHLRFGNIPKSWIGISAGLLFVAGFLTIWNFQGGDNDFTEIEQTKSVQPSLEITQEQSARQKIDDNALEVQISSVNEITEPLSANSGGNDIVSNPELLTSNQNTSVINTNPQATYSNQQIALENSETKIEEPVSHVQINPISDQTTETSELNNDKINNEPEAAIGVAAVAATSSVSTNLPKVAGTTPSTTVDQPDFINQTQSDLTTKSGVNTSQEEVNELSASAAIGLANLKEPAKIEGAAYDAMSAIKSNSISAEEIKMQTGSNTRVEESSSPMKMKTINSLSIGPIFNSKYKPPKREFQDPMIMGYRGYKPYFSLSAYFAPEFTEYFRVASESRERSYSGGLALSYVGQSYMVQAGLEYSATQDLGDYMVNLNSYDSIGYYNGISGFEIIPGDAGEDSLLYHYHTVEVWDTLQHHSHQQTQNNYSYLQVPLMFGYKAMERGLFTAYIKAGPNFSFLLNRQEQTLNYQAGSSARIIGIDNYTAPRMTANVQVLVSVALQFQFTERFGLLVEPTYRYYLKSVYDVNGESLKNPYGIGIRGGLIYNF